MSSIGDGSARAITRLQERIRALETEAAKVPDLQAEVERLRDAAEHFQPEMYVYRRNGWTDEEDTMG